MVDALPLAVDRHGHRHVLNLELVDRLHSEVLEADDLAALDRAGDEISGAADGHQIGGAVLADGIDRHGAALGLADHGEQALLQHHAGELVHAGGGGRSEEHTSELQSLMRISYAVFCLKKKKNNESTHTA